MLNYIPVKGPGIAELRKQMMQRIDVTSEDEKILSGDEDSPLEIEQGDLLGSTNESLNYNPAIGDFSSPVSERNRDITELNKDNPSDDPLLQADSDAQKEKVLHLSDKDMVQYVPSDVVNYYNEAALTAKQRKELPPEAFGLPRLRAYPLTDEKHVRQAIRMFHHCRDPKDKATLAKNIFKKVEEFGINVTIGKDNPLHDYAPKSMQEASFTPTAVVFGMDTPMGKRTKEQIVREHLRTNSMFYNHLFYGGDFVKSVRAIEEYTFFDFFYPNFKTHSLYARLKTALGGLGMCAEMYDQLGIRAPLETDFTKPLGYVSAQEAEDKFELAVNMNYQDGANWLQANLGNDLDHIFYCTRLYSLLGEIMNNPAFDMKTLDERHVGLMTDWLQRVMYHYDLMQEEVEYSKEYIRQAQYLYDLFWNFNDNPLSEDCAISNVVAMIANMASADKLLDSMNEAGGELVDKTDTAAYMVKELGMDDDVFLLPGSLEYPVINKSSVRMAMDLIVKIDPDNVKEYTTNLNRKYKELGCTFSITPDHPYAQYADKEIISHMTRVLMEGDTGVADDGTSAANSGGMSAEDPWYKRQEMLGSNRDLLPDTEMGPNDKKVSQDVTPPRLY